MKRLFLFAGLLCLAAMPALAGSSSDHVKIAHDFTLGGKQMPAGDYDISWTGAGDKVQVTLRRRHWKTPVTATATATQQAATHGYNGYVTNPGENFPELTLIMLRDFDLVFNSGPAQ